MASSGVAKYTCDSKVSGDSGYVTGMKIRSIGGDVDFGVPVFPAGATVDDIFKKYIEGTTGSGGVTVPDQSISTYVKPLSFTGPGSSWWNVGDIYLDLSKKLNANLNHMVDLINKNVKGTGILSAITAYRNGYGGTISSRGYTLSSSGTLTVDLIGKMSKVTTDSGFILPNGKWVSDKVCQKREITLTAGYNPATWVDFGSRKNCGGRKEDCFDGAPFSFPNPEYHAAWVNEPALKNGGGRPVDTACSDEVGVANPVDMFYGKNVIYNWRGWPEGDANTKIQYVWPVFNTSRDSRDKQPFKDGLEAWISDADKKKYSNDHKLPPENHVKGSGNYIRMTYNMSSSGITSSTGPLTKMFLISALQNKSWTGSVGDSSQNQSDNVSNILLQVNSLPQKLLLPLEYLAMYARLAYPLTSTDTTAAGFTNTTVGQPLVSAMSAGDYHDHLLDPITAILQQYQKLGLVQSDKVADPSGSKGDGTKQLLSNLNNGMSKLFKSIQPHSYKAGDAEKDLSKIDTTFPSEGDQSEVIDPGLILSALKKLYSFGVTTSAPKDPGEMIGKQYDFITQLQQLGIELVSSSVGTMEQIGRSYDETFVNNENYLNKQMQALSSGSELESSSNWGEIDAAKNLGLGPNGYSKNGGRAGIAAIGSVTVASEVMMTFGGPFTKAAGLAMYFGAQMANVVTGTKEKIQVLNKMQKISHAKALISSWQLENIQKMEDNQVVQLKISALNYKMSTSMTKSMMMLPLAFAVMTMLFTLGITFGIVIPMTPYIYFWAGKTSWLISTVEAMIAAPFLSIALLIPHGHSYFGHMIPGFRMLLNVILRPVLLVIGALTSMILIYVIVVYSAQGFHVISKSVISSFPMSISVDPRSAANTQAVLSLMVMTLYGTFLTMAFNKCFDLIHLIPETVVQWIGGQSDQFGKEDMQKISQSAQQGSKQIGQAGSQAGKGSASTAQQLTSAKGDEASQMADINNSEIGSKNAMADTESSQLSNEGDQIQNQGDQDQAMHQAVTD